MLTSEDFCFVSKGMGGIPSGLDEPVEGEGNYGESWRAVHAWKEGGDEMKPEEIRRQVGKRVTLTLAAGALGGSTITGRLVGTTEAADGLVIHVEPDDDQPGARLTIHYHHVVTLAPSGS